MQSPSKILHVGGVGWNSYLNSKLLTERGYVSHVAANDMYHCICSPEWHELPDGSIDRSALGDDFFPNFFCIPGSKACRPRWFAQGPQLFVIAYLTRLVQGDAEGSEMLWQQLQFLRFKAVLRRTTVPQTVHLDETELDAALADLRIADEHVADLRAAWQLNRTVVRFVERVAQATGLPKEHLVPPFAPGFVDEHLGHDAELAAEIAAIRASGRAPDVGLERLVDDRAQKKNAGSPLLAYLDRLSSGVSVTDAARIDVRRASCRPDDAALYGSVIKDWNALFRAYDKCLFYGGSAVLGLLSDLPRYMAYEHGTIRSLPFEETANGRLTRIAYEKAGAVFITNTDYIAATPRLEFAPETRVYLPHAFDERPLFAYAAKHRRGRRPGPVRFFNPSRQDWVLGDPACSKGNHLIVDAAAELVRDGETGFEITFVEWGEDVAATRQRIADLGLDAHVRWISPVTRTMLWGLLLDADAVLDQFVISGMSGVTYDSLALGCRVITRDDGVCNKGFFGESPPFMAAMTAAEITAHFRTIVADPDDNAGRGREGQAWMAEYHSAERFVALQEAQFERLYDPVRTDPLLAVQALIDGTAVARLLAAPANRPASPAVAASPVSPRRPSVAPLANVRPQPIFRSKAMSSADATLSMRSIST